MKIAAIFLIAFLATGYASMIPSREVETEVKSTVSNILLARCLQKKVDQIKQDVATVTGVVGTVGDVVESNQQKLEECKQIGGENPSIIDQIAQTTCSINVAKNLKTELLAAVSDVTSAIDELIHIRSTISECFN